MFTLLLLALPQQVWLEEDFSSGVPPAGWDEQLNSANSGWEKGTYMGDAAFHTDFTTVSDNLLATPALDFSTASEVWLHWDQNNEYSLYRDHHYISVSFDGGITWTRLGEDLAGDGNCSWSINVSAFSGMSSVQFAFEYTGQFSSRWTIDNVSVTDSIYPAAPGILGTVSNPNNGQTYHLLEASTWTAAEGAAISLGGHLAEINDSTENDWIFSSFGAACDLLIGLNDTAIEDTFFWSFGRLPVYTNWAFFQPNNLTNVHPLGENHVAMYGAGQSFAGKWYDYHHASLTSNGTDICGVVEIPPSPEPVMVVNNLSGGQTCTINISNATPNNVAYVVFSVWGGGPFGSNLGPAMVTPPFSVIPIPTDASGSASMSNSVPPGATGRTVWFHGADGGSATLLDALALVVG